MSTPPTKQYVIAQLSRLREATATSDGLEARAILEKLVADGYADLADRLVAELLAPAGASVVDAR